MKSSFPANPRFRHLHLGLTALLVIAGATLAGLALAGRVHFGAAAQTPDRETKKAREKGDAEPSGKCQIEKVEEGQDVLLAVSRSGFLGEALLDAWVFKYRGGIVECRLEEGGAGERGFTFPSAESNKTLIKEATIYNDSSSSLNGSGYIILAATQTPDSLKDGLARHHVHLGGVLSFASYGPLHALAPLHLEVNHKYNYRLLVSVNPILPGLSSPTILWVDQPIPIRAPILSRDAAREEFYVRGKKDFQPGKEELLLDRKRGFSRVRLKARFLGEGEVQALFAK